MNIAVLGCGNMGRAIASGLRSRYAGEVSLVVHDKDASAVERLESVFSVAAPDEWFAGDAPPEVVVVAVKPQDIAGALAAFAGAGEIGGALWISIAAGVSLERLGDLLGKGVRIARVMPNAPALIGEGVSAYALNGACTADDARRVEYVLRACGNVVAVPERLMNAVTGLSGSGPAYVFLFIEALIEGGVSAGLPYATARDLAVQTVVGAARMVQSTGESPGQLKVRVMSPGGTTVEGLKKLEKESFRYAVMQAVQTAAQRAEELGK